jgi:7-carboxy-7-deazaguanine synthase
MREGGRHAKEHENRRINLDVIRRFMEFPHHQLKFVIEAPEDLTEIDGILTQLGKYESTNVLLMPQGVTREDLTDRGRWIVDICKKRGFRYCPRIQIRLYGNTRGT